MSLPRLYESDATSFGTKGLGAFQPTMCMVTEEINGEYELEMDITMDDPMFKYLQIGRIILAPHDANKDWQPFEIYSIENRLDGVAHVNAWHYNYVWDKYIIKPIPEQTRTVSDIASAIPSYVAGGFDASYFPNLIGGGGKINSAVFGTTEPMSFRKLIMKMIEVYDAEVIWGYILGASYTGAIAPYNTCYLVSQRGSNSDLVFRYGSNLVSMQREQTAEDVFTAIYPYWTGPGTNYSGDITVTLPEEILYVTSLSNYYRSRKLIIPLDLSDEFETQPTVTQLRNKAQAWLSANSPFSIPENIDVSVLQMDEEGMDSVATLVLGDTLTVAYYEMNIRVSARITKTVYNVLLDRYDSLSIGTAKNMNTAIKKVVGKIK